MGKIFITGGTGFFGKSLLSYRKRHPELNWDDWMILSRNPDEFIKKYPSLVSDGVGFCKGDLLSFENSEEDFDGIWHLASPLQGCLPDEEMTFQIVEGARRISTFAQRKGIQKILFASSGAVYGLAKQALDESHCCVPQTAYGKAKLSVEKMFVSAGMDVKLARCFAFVGPYLPRRAHFAIGNFIEDCLRGRPIVLKGDGTPLRSYLYADDLVEWLLKIFQDGVSGRPYNVGSDEAVSIKELACRVRNALNVSCEVRVLGAQSSSMANVYVPVTRRIESELGVVRKFALEMAIRNSIG